MLPKIKCLFLKNFSIFNQLLIEEYLFRTQTENFLICNQGSPDAIVMGRTNKIHELIESKQVQANKTPVIRRYSAGGTVYVDQDTFFLSFILSKNTLSLLEPKQFTDNQVYPDSLLTWHHKLLKGAFPADSLQLLEQDLCLNSKKIAGQAQAFARERVVHHSTFLIRFNPENMRLLKIPSKQPKYRKNRAHSDFISSIEQATGFSAQTLEANILTRVKTQFSIEEFKLNAAEKKTIFDIEPKQKAYRQETILLSGL